MSWIELDGTANTRTALDRPRLIRSDNLQDLTPADVALLLDGHGVRAVADLRTEVELGSEGPAPLDDRVDIRRLSLFPVAGHSTDFAADQPVILPWQGRSELTPDRVGAVKVYLGYLVDRPDSILDALRLIAHTDGATIVHCAAGKDRTGVVVALALLEVGAERSAVVEDYAMTADRGTELIARLAASRTYSADVGGKPAQYHLPRAETMAAFLDALDAEFGGGPAWLRQHGWTDADAAALRRALAE